MVQRNASIEEWPMKTLVSLIWALMVLVITNVYLFRDKFRRMAMERRKHEPENTPTPFTKIKIEEFKLVLID